MGVFDGQSVSAGVTNPAFIDANQDDSTLAKLALNDQDVSTVSGSQVVNAQRELNSEASFTGKSLNSAKNDLPSYTNDEGFTANQNLKTRLDGVSGKFKQSGGHSHNPALTGDGAPIQASYLQGVSLRALVQQGVDIVGVTGSSSDISLQFSLKNPSSNATTLGVVVNNPQNMIAIRQASGANQGDSYLDSLGNIVYARVTYAASVWTLNFYSLISSTETAYSFASASNVSFYYQEIYNPLTGGPVYNPMLFIPSENTTADVVDASSTQRGVVTTGNQSFAGEKDFTGNVQIQSKVFGDVETNSVATGASAALTNPNKLVVLLTNASLTSILSVAASSPVKNQNVILINKTGADVIINNSNANAGEILTGTGSNITFKNNQAVFLSYDATNLRWVLCGSGGAQFTTQAIGSTPNANGYSYNTLTGQFQLQPSSSAFGGAISIVDQDFKGEKRFTEGLAFQIGLDATTIGAAATIDGGTVGLVKVQNAGLTGISLIIRKNATSRLLVLINGTGATITINNLSGTETSTAKQVRTGTGANLSMVANASLFLIYDENSDKWQAVGTVASLGTIPISQGGTGQTTAVTAFNALSPIGAKGDLISNDGTNDIALPVGTDAFVLTADSTTASGLKWAASTGGSGGATNLITNGSADNATVSIFTPYLNTAQSRPVTGAGGSPTVTTSLSSTAPLTGTKSFILSKTAANSQGQGWAATFSVDPSYRAKSLKISVDYIVSSGTFAAGNNSTPSDGDVIWYLYDISNSQLIEPSNIKMFSSSTTISDSFQATFQTSVTGSSYRLIAHVASTSALAFDLKVDNITVSPQVYVYGTPITDEVAYTPTFTGFGTVTGIDFTIGKIGDKAIIRGKFTSGTSTAVEARMSIPYTVDSTKISVLKVVGKGNTNISAPTNFGGMSILAEPSTQYLTFGGETSTGSGTTKTNGSALVSNGNIVSFEAIVPIVGWSSSVQMSDSADTRVIQAKYRFTSKNSSATLPFNFDTLVSDTHGAVTPSATVWKFTAPSSGKYFVGIQHSSAGSTVTTYLYKNGSQVDQIFTGAFTLNNGSMNGSTEIDLNIGDYIDVRLDSAISGITSGYINIFKIQGPQAIAASESVNCRYTNTAGTSIANSGADIVVPFATKDYDTHGAFVTDTFTAPIAGKYEVSASLSFSGSLYAAGNQYYATVYKNGSLHSYGIIQNIMAALTVNIGSIVTTTVNCIAGDAIVVRISNNRTAGATALSTTAGVNHLEIKRIGN